MKRLIILFCLLGIALGIGYWFWQQSLKPTPPETIQVAPHRWKVNTNTRADSANTDNQNNENASLSTNATNATTNATLAEDSVIKHTFVQDFIHQAVSLYLPAGSKRNPGKKGILNLNLRRMNLRYGIDFPGMEVNRENVLIARKTVLQHALTPQTLELLALAYEPLFHQELTAQLDTAIWITAKGEAAPLTPKHKQEMRHLLGVRLQSVGAVLRSLAESLELPKLVQAYLNAQENVNAAHLAFWNAQAENAQPATLDKTNSAMKASIQRRELARQNILLHLAQIIPAHELTAAELLYLAQWVQRRHEENPTVLPALAKAGSLLFDTGTAVLQTPQTQLPPQ